MEKIEIEINYDQHSVESVKGLPENAEVRLREYDCNHGYLITFYEVKNGEPVRLKQEIECPSCGGSGKDDMFVTLADQGKCAYCEDGFIKK